MYMVIACKRKLVFGRSVASMDVARTLWRMHIELLLISDYARYDKVLESLSIIH